MTIGCQSLRMSCSPRALKMSQPLNHPLLLGKTHYTVIPIWCHDTESWSILVFIMIFFFFPLSFLSNIDKYVVCHTQLMMLFATCPSCFEATQASIVRQEGTFIKIQQVRCFTFFLSHKYTQTVSVENPLENEMVHLKGLFPKRNTIIVSVFISLYLSPNEFEADGCPH